MGLNFWNRVMHSGYRTVAIPELRLCVVRAKIWEKRAKGRDLRWLSQTIYKWTERKAKKREKERERMKKEKYKMHKILFHGKMWNFNLKIFISHSGKRDREHPHFTYKHHKEICNIQRLFPLCRDQHKHQHRHHYQLKGNKNTRKHYKRLSLASCALWFLPLSNYNKNLLLQRIAKSRKMCYVLLHV